MADIVLRDRSGNPLDYSGINKLKVKRADGETQAYAAYDPDTLIPENLAEGVVVGGVTGTLSTPESEEKTVELDFSSGDDMTVEPTAGNLLSKVTLTKPETLLPENIAEGIDIAGILGTLAAGGGGLVPNGTTMEYKVPSGVTVNAGDFVMQAKGITSQRLPTSSDTNKYAYHTSSCELPDGRIFIAHIGYVSGTNLYGTILTIGDDESITSTTPAILDSSGVAYSSGTPDGYVDSVVLSDGRVLIVYRGSNSSYGYIKAALVTINDDDSLSAVTTGLSYYTYAAIGGIQLLLLQDGRPLLLHSGYESSSSSYSSYYYLFGKILNISGDTITTEATATIASGQYIARMFDAILLSDGRVFATFCGDSGSTSTRYYLRYRFLTISNTTITAAGDYLTTSYITTPIYMTSVELPDNRVLVVHGWGLSSGYVAAYSLLRVADGASTLISRNTNLFVKSYVACQLNSIVLPDGRVYVKATGGNSSTYPLAHILITIDGTTVNAKYVELSSFSYSGNCRGSLHLIGDKVLLIHKGTMASDSQTYYLYACKIVPELLVTNASVTAGDIFGIAATDASDGEMVTIYRPTNPTYY